MFRRTNSFHNMSSVDRIDTTRTNPTSSMEKFFLSAFRKDELYKIKTFRVGMDVNNHLRNLDTKFADLHLPVTEQAQFIMDSLEDCIQDEVQAQLEFKGNRNNPLWIKSKLRSLYQMKKSPVSNLVDLLKVKQQPHQNLREYVRDIRVAAWKLMGDEDEEERENFMVAAFINGIANCKCSQALRQLQPSTLDQAFSMVKHEGITSAPDAELRTMACDPPVELNRTVEMLIRKMMSELSELRRQVSLLTAKHHNHSNLRNDSTQKVILDQRRKVICYNCNTEGHIARYCKAAPICRYCKEEGHSIDQCPNKRNSGKQAPHFRQVEMSDALSTSNTFEMLEEENVSEIITPLNNIDIAILKTAPGVGKSTVKQPSNCWTHVRKSNVMKPNRNELNWTNYVNGNGSMPRRTITGSKTVISKTNPEHAANKPVVRAKVERQNKNIFLDSGSENNVMDKEFFLKLGRPLHPANCALRCANGSPLKVIGYAVVGVQIGSKSFLTKFSIVDKIFPHVIIGIRSMKKHDISVNPARDCIYIKSEKISFLSEVQLPQENC